MRRPSRFNPNHRRSAAIETTNICNANCIFCGYQFQKRPRGVQTFEQFQHLATMLRENAPAVDILNFTPIVGDPLVDKKVLEKIKFAKEIGFPTIWLTTNLIGMESAEALLSSGVDLITISMPEPDEKSYKEIYRSLRFFDFLRNLDELTLLNQKSGWPVRISLVLRGPRSRWLLLRSSGLVRRFVGRLKFGLLDMQVATEFDNWDGLIKESDLLSGMTIRPNPKKKDPCFMLGFYGFTWDNRMVACACRDLNVHSDLDCGPATPESIAAYHAADSPLVRIKQDWAKGKLPSPCVDCRQYRPASAFFSD